MSEAPLAVTGEHDGSNVDVRSVSELVRMKVWTFLMRAASVDVVAADTAGAAS